MKSALLLCATVGAVSDASKCQADEATMLQGLNTVRLRSKAMPAKDAKSMLKNMRDVANSLVEGSDTTMSQDEVNDALDETAEALARLAPVLRQQFENAQQQIDDAISAFQGCQTIELRDDVGQLAAAVESCTNTLDELRTAEAQQCDIAEDCLCDEARVRTTDKEELCASKTQTYEVAFCDHHAACNALHQCHAREAEVYSRLRADVEAEMALLAEEYTVVEQVRCLNDLSREAITPPISRIDPSASAACLDVDVSTLRINYPNLPAAPAACPAHQHGEPECVAGTAPHGSDPVLVMKAVSDLFAYSSPLWENDETFAPESAPEVEEDAKYEEFNDTPFNTITLCFGGPSSQCIRHALPQTYSSARALFSAGQIETDTIDQAAWIAAFESDNECPMVKPGFNIECPETGTGSFSSQSRVRFGWCSHWWRLCASDESPIRNIDVEDTDDSIGLGVDNVYHRDGGYGGSYGYHSAGEVVRQDGLGGAGAGWTQQFNSGRVGYGLRSVWIYVQQA